VVRHRARRHLAGVLAAHFVCAIAAAALPTVAAVTGVAGVAGVATAPAPIPQQPSTDIADFIVNIARYASWPKTTPTKNLTVCYALGAAQPSLHSPAGHDGMVKGVSVIWQPMSSPQQIAGCHIVWLSADVRPAPRRWLAAVVDQPVLTLSNYADFAADGGIIGAYRVGPDWRFEINIEALQRSGVSIAAAALRLSQRPRTGPITGEQK
jgi:hypothetical protein